MTDPHRCVALIEDVREAALNPANAYLVRTRISRAILEATRMAARSSGAEGPIVPGPFVLPAAASTRDREIVELCNSIYEETRSLCQPSEALEDRWRLGWARVSARLDALARAVASTKEAAVP